MIREFIYVNLEGDEVAMVEIVDENGNATQMTKSTYEAQQVEHLTENPTEDVE